MHEVVDVVSNVHIYPIKSLHAATVHGEPPCALDVGPTGFEANSFVDRGIVIADSSGLFVSQRGWDRNKHVAYAGDKRLATVSVDIQADHLAVEAPGFGREEVGHPEVGEISQEVTILDKSFYGFEIATNIANYFSRLLEREVKLYEVDTSRPRLLAEQYWRPEASNQIAGADGMPFLLTSHTSLDELVDQQQLPYDSVALSRYRANIEVSGETLGPFGEDHALELRIGALYAYIVKACERCRISNIDQQTGKWDKLSNRLLNPSRLGWPIESYKEGAPKPLFGQNLNHVWRSTEPTTVRQGDPIVIYSSSDQPNLVLKSSRHK